MNVDTAVNSEQGLTGLGAIVRNVKGKAMAAATWRHIFPNDMEFAEASAIYEGLRMATSVGLHPLVIESDSKNVVDLIQEKTKSICEIGWLIFEVQALSNVVRCIVQSVPRPCNMVAHRLAKLALLYPDDRVWLVICGGLYRCRFLLMKCFLSKIKNYGQLIPSSHFLCLIPSSNDTSTIFMVIKVL